MQQLAQIKGQQQHLGSFPSNSQHPQASSSNTQMNHQIQSMVHQQRPVSVPANSGGNNIQVATANQTPVFN